MSRKDFNKGMEAGARPFEEKYRQMGKQFEEFSQKANQNFDQIKETNEAILNEVDSMQKKQFYRDNTAVDISILAKGDRETLLSLLFTLAETEEELTGLQQLFIRSVKKYLETVNEEEKPEDWSVLKKDDWSIIETISGIEETKAVAQVVMEFLFLGYDSHEEYMNEYEDLFDYFCLNRKAFREIETRIDNICRATGLQGIAEKYGRVLEELEKEKAEEVVEQHYGTSGKLSSEHISTDITVTAGARKVYKDKKLFFEAKIVLMNNAKLVFENCDISVGEMSGEVISCSDEGRNISISFENCTIHHNRKSGYFIKDTSIGYRTQKVTVKFLGCDFSKCQNIMDIRGYAGSFSESYTDSVTIERSRVNIDVKKGESSFNCGNLGLIDSLIFMEEREDDTSFGEEFFSYNSIMHIEKCHFINLVFRIEVKDSNDPLEQSIFENCTLDMEYKTGNDGMLLVNDCKFKSCYFRGHGFEALDSKKLHIENSEFKDCTGNIEAIYMGNVVIDGGYPFIQISGFTGLELINCKFLNWSYEKCENKGLGYVDTAVLIKTESSSSRISGCTFENLQLGDRYLIGGRDSRYELEDCTFDRIQSSKGILRKQKEVTKKTFMGTKKEIIRTLFTINNCKGL